MGMMSVTILAKSRDDFPAIREETERRRQEYDTVIGENGYSLIYRNRPYDQEKNAAGMAANIEPDVDQARRQRLIIFIILLIVPAINLSSMTQSRLRQRVAEIGVRRAFGSTRLELMGQIIAENLVVTLLAGDGIVAECSIRLFGKYTAVCAGIQPDAESSGSGCEHIAAWLHLWLGVVVLLCAKLTKFRYSRMACIKNRDCKCIGRTFA